MGYWHYDQAEPDGPAVKVWRHGNAEGTLYRGDKFTAHVQSYGSQPDSLHLEGFRDVNSAFIDYAWLNYLASLNYNYGPISSVNSYDGPKRSFYLILEDFISFIERPDFPDKDFKTFFNTPRKKWYNCRYLSDIPCQSLKKGAHVLKCESISNFIISEYLDVKALKYTYNPVIAEKVDLFREVWISFILDQKAKYLGSEADMNFYLNEINTTW